MNTDILSVIFSFLPWSVLEKLQDIPLCPSIRKELCLKKKWIRNNIPTPLIDIINMERLLDSPFLKWKQHFEGFTGYIDKIEPSDVSFPIMMGQDTYGRPFITIRTKRHDTNQFCVVTLFQRYTLSNNWTFGKKGLQSWIQSCMYFYTNHKLDTRFHILFHQLMSQGFVQVKHSREIVTNYVLM